MAPYLGPPLYAAFVWWFSTGAVLLLVGLSARFEIARALAACALIATGFYGLVSSAADLSVGGAYMAFTATILLWGAQEIAFLSGWLTGPRAEPCVEGARGWSRLKLALLAILYHELSLLACGLTIWLATVGAINQVGLWTFAALWVLRQSAKINLFLGVPVTNDSLMPSQVRFLKTYFACRPVGAFFVVSVTVSIAVLAILIQRMVEVADTPYEITSLALVSTLFALGIVEHWFMLLPLPALTLWGWGVRTQPKRESTMALETLTSDLAVASTLAMEPPRTTPPQLVIVTGSKRDARQRLEDQFRQRFKEQARADLESAGLSTEPAAMSNGRTL
jgi:putative photosynthetic complex assembly protein 2